jgi:hypothetical protein
MKVKILAEDTEGNEEYIDMWFDSSTAVGFYITQANTIEGSVNVLLANETVTLLQTKELIDFLTKKFVN